MTKQRGLKSGDGRVARLARWLENVPASADFDTLRLEVKNDGEWSSLQRWERAVVTTGLAQEIDGLIVDYANELGAYVHGRVVWWASETDRYWTEHALRCQPEDMEGAQAFSSDPGSAIIQTQRHLEFMARTHVGGFAQAMRAMEQGGQYLERANDVLTQQNTDMREQLQAAREELAATQKLLDEAVTTIEELEKRIDEAPSNDKQAQIIELATQAISKAR